MSNYKCYEPILNRNLQELRMGNKNIKEVKKIKIFDEDVLAEKLQESYRYEPNYAIESVKFSYNGYNGRSLYVQDLWQRELRLYHNTPLSRKPATMSFYCPTIYDCHISNCHEYFSENTIDEIIKTQLLLTAPNHITESQIINETREDIMRCFLNYIYTLINQILADSKNNGQLRVVSLLPITYDKDCPSYFSITEKIIPTMNALLSDYCAKHGIKFINAFPHFATKIAGQLREDLSDDGLFLNNKGYELLTALVSKEIQQENLAKLRQTPAEQ